MKILIISNGHSVTTSGVSVSGGDIRWIEIAKRWASFGNSLSILTVPEGRILCEKLGLNAKFYLIKNSQYKNNILFDYASRAYDVTFKLGDVFSQIQFDLVYSVTEHYYDVWPAWRLKRMSPEIKWSAVVHWVAPLVREGKFMSNLLFAIQQKLGLSMISNSADSVLAVSEGTKKSLIKNMFSPSRICIVECGVNWLDIQNFKKTCGGIDKSYDAVFLKRFHSAKGVFDLIEIWNYVVAQNHDAKLLMIGGGSEEILSQLNRIVDAKGLSQNVTIMGVVYDNAYKIRLLLKSRLFVLPSFEENWGIAIGEALACGLPVICYGLPEIIPIWQDSVIWVKKGDKQEFAKKILDLLSSPTHMAELSEYGIEFVKRYSWDNIAINELKVATQ